MQLNVLYYTLYNLKYTNHQTKKVKQAKIMQPIVLPVHIIDLIPQKNRA